MIHRFLRRPEWEAKLRSIGAEPLPGLTPLNTAEWWRRPGQPPFTVPTEPDGRCEFWAIQKIVEAQAGSSLFKPPRDD